MKNAILICLIISYTLIANICISLDKMYQWIKGFSGFLSYCFVNLFTGDMPYFKLILASIFLIISAILNEWVLFIPALCIVIHAMFDAMIDGEYVYDYKI